MIFLPKIFDKMSTINSVSDSIQLTINDDFLLISCHISGSSNKCIKEMNIIFDVVNQHQEKKVIICGDFNATLKKEVDSLNIYDKEDLTLTHSISITRDFQVSNFISTTGKSRCLTTQFNKMFKPAFASIDAFIVIYPEGFVNEKEMECKALYDQEITEEVTFPPPSFPSDHAKIKYFLEGYGWIYSFNCFGESVRSGPPLNIYEMMTQKMWDRYLSDETIQLEFQRLLSELSLVTLNEKNFKTLVKEKILSKATRNLAICGSVFLPPSDPSINTNTVFYQTLLTVYSNGLTAYNNSSQEIKDAASIVLNFYESCLYSPILKQFFVDWYLELEKGYEEKRSFLDVIEEDLENNEIFAYCLQEVSDDMIEDLMTTTDFRSMGYKVLYFDKTDSKEKTRGAMIIKV